MDICNAYDIDIAQRSEQKLENIKTKITAWEKKYGSSLKARRDILDRR